MGGSIPGVGVLALLSWPYMSCDSGRVVGLERGHRCYDQGDVNEYDGKGGEPVESGCG